VILVECRSVNGGNKCTDEIIVYQRKKDGKRTKTGKYQQEFPVSGCLFPVIENGSK
jgi:hypothetical protein